MDCKVNNYYVVRHVTIPAWFPMSERKPQINLVVTEEQKARWETYLNDESDEFRSLSQLIRRSVEKEITDQPTVGDGGMPEDLTRQLSQITEGLNRIESRMDDFDGRLSMVEREVRNDPGIKQLASEVFELLPAKDDIIEYEKLTQKSGSKPPGQPVTHDGTAESLANTLNEEKFRIEQALEQLQNDTHQVHTIKLADEVPGWAEAYDGGETDRYYKQG